MVLAFAAHSTEDYSMYAERRKYAGVSAGWESAMVTDGHKKSRSVQKVKRLTKIMRDSEIDGAPIRLHSNDRT
jgi:hypothetical protein